MGNPQPLRQLQWLADDLCLGVVAEFPPIAADIAVKPVMEVQIADGMDTSLPILR